MGAPDKLVAVAGASGFIGGSVLAGLKESRYRGVGIVRSDSSRVTGGCSWNGSVRVADFQNRSSLLDVFSDVSTLIYCAGRAGLSGAPQRDSLGSFRTTNVQVTRVVAEQAAAAGVNRFIYLSTAKVFGERSVDGVPFSPSSKASPEDNYAISKLEAELELWRVAAATGLEMVILRAPMVYGRGGRGNFQRLARLIRMGLPMPLAAIDNLRSYISIDNLVDCIIRCIDHPAAAGATLLVSDGHDVSTPEFAEAIAAALSRHLKLFPVREACLMRAGYLLGREADVRRLVDSFQLDIDNTRALLGWVPPLSIQEGISRAVCKSDNP